MIPNERRSSPAAPTFSIISIIAALCAVFAFRSVGLGIVLAVLAIVFGIIGAVIALSPNKRGGLISIFAIAAGAIGIVVAVFRLIARAV